MKTIEVAQHAAQSLQPGSPPLPTPPEWTALNLQRKTVIEDEVSSLKNILGPGLARKLDSYIKNQIAPDMTTLQKKEVQQ